MSTDQTVRLQSILKELHLNQTLAIFEEEAQKAAKTKMSYIGYLAKLMEEEILYKTDRSINRKIQVAKFPRMKTLEDFDFGFQSGLNSKEVIELSNLRFIDQKENVIFVGPPGVGKSHLAIALGVKACIARYRVLFISAKDLIRDLYASLVDQSTAEKIEALSRLHLLIIDELGYMPVDTEGANLFFQLISRRYECGSIILTTNMPFDQWDKIFGDQVISAAIIDRLAHHCHIFSINGCSYRMKDKLPQEN